MFLNGYLVAIKIISISHQIPNPPPVMSLRIPSHTWPMIKRSIPKEPKKIDITSARSQLTLWGLLLSIFTYLSFLYYKDIFAFLQTSLYFVQDNSIKIKVPNSYWDYFIHIRILCFLIEQNLASDRGNFLEYTRIHI